MGWICGGEVLLDLISLLCFLVIRPWLRSRCRRCVGLPGPSSNIDATYSVLDSMRHLDYRLSCVEIAQPLELFRY